MEATIFETPARRFPYGVWTSICRFRASLGFKVYPKQTPEDCSAWFNDTQSACRALTNICLFHG